MEIIKKVSVTQLQSRLESNNLFRDYKIRAIVIKHSKLKDLELIITKDYTSKIPVETCRNLVSNYEEGLIAVVAVKLVCCLLRRVQLIQNK